VWILVLGFFMFLLAVFPQVLLSRGRPGGFGVEGLELFQIKGR